jgi:hypothetical protein
MDRGRAWILGAGTTDIWTTDIFSHFFKVDFLQVLKEQK